MWGLGGHQIEVIHYLVSSRTLDIHDDGPFVHMKSRT